MIKVPNFNAHNIIYILSKKTPVFKSENLSKDNFDKPRIYNEFTEMVKKKSI